MHLARLIAAFLALFLVLDTAGALPEGFAESFKSGKSEWYRGEPVELTYRVCNVSDRDLQPCQLRCALFVSIHRENGEPIVSTRPGGCGAACTDRVWQPGECDERRFIWPQTGGELQAGLDAGDQVSPGAFYASLHDGSDPIFTAPFEILGIAIPVPAAGALAMTLLIVLLGCVGCRAVRPPGK